MKTDDVGLAKQGVQLDVISSDFGECGSLEKIVVENFSRRNLEQPGEHATDLSGSDDSDYLTVEVKAKETIDRKIGVAHAIVCPVDSANSATA